MSVRWGAAASGRWTLPALLETAGHSLTALLLTILVLCAAAMAVTL